MFHPASPSSVIAFLLICCFVLVAFLRGIWISARSEGGDSFRRTFWAGFGIVLWLGLCAVLVASGWVEEVPAHLLAFGGGIVLVSVLIGGSQIGKWLAWASPVPWLLAFQGFRLPLELVLHDWAGQGVIPKTMTWTGSNWDILSGVVALVLAPFCRRSRLAAWAGNVVGFILLLNVGRVAVLSAAVPFGWHDVVPKLLLPYHLPYALIVPICVGGALVGHIVLSRALLRVQR